MLQSHKKFHSSNGKRQILIAEDELINRQILKVMLENDYELVFAENGIQTLEQMRENQGTLSLVLLDILMPEMSGMDVLRAVRSDPFLSNIPIIVTTAETETEVESLRLGAIDFIPKPYPASDVIQARILRTIELSEDRDIIQSTERDALTGLYNREYFYRYAEQFDAFHKEQAMDAIIVDVNHFRMINERYGKAYGDEVLRRIGEQVRLMVADSGGIVCRRTADTFMVYCPHREDYQEIMDKASVYLQDDESGEYRVRLRMGVYSNADKSIDIERRFDRAKMAADTVKGSFAKTIGFYDNSLHEKQLYAEQLIEDFPAAIAENQFKVFYQPKFDVRPDTPVLTSAEALVRWFHPRLGMISPGVFIPLFEENGLIRQLDMYVWKETARQIREWKDRLEYSIPVSVNVSRVDMYDPNLKDTLQDILKENDLSGRDLLLEVTESAYTQDSNQIIETVENLRSLGFQIEMDDFGTGYSSLNMIANLPIDALKLDMQFIRSAFAEGGNTHMLEVIIGIADYLSVPVIAEGVETEAQLHALKLLGCDIVQGYFFSRPVNSDEFEPFILQKKQADIAEAKRTEAEFNNPEEDMARQAKLNALKEKTEPEQTEQNTLQVPEEPAGRGIYLRRVTYFFAVLALIASALLMYLDIAVTSGYQRMEKASSSYIAAQNAAADMQTGSDYLTDRVRCFVVTGDIRYLTDFVTEVETTRRRDNAVERLADLLGDRNSYVLDSLNTALDLSNELVKTENLSMRLMLETDDYDLSNVPADIRNIPLGEKYQNMSAEELKQTAQDMVFNDQYMSYKDRISDNVSLCTKELIRISSQELEQASDRLASMVRAQTAVTVIFLMIILAVVLIISRMIRIPLSRMVRHMENQEMIPPTGVEELRFVTRTYNNILRENYEAREKLSHEASHDALTGLFNRGAYDLLMESADADHMALILIDVDYFKEVNDTYGHAVGDRILKKVADILKHSFRSVDILCRIGGDEFAVVMTRVTSAMSQIVLSKMNRMNDLLQHPTDDLPAVSISAGVAFSDRKNPRGDIYQDADRALYKVKEAGRKGCSIYE